MSGSEMPFYFSDKLVQPSANSFLASHSASLLQLVLQLAERNKCEALTK